jgi:hypothetical protein
MMTQLIANSVMMKHTLHTSRSPDTCARLVSPKNRYTPCGVTNVGMSGLQNALRQITEETTANGDFFFFIFTDLNEHFILF